MPPVLALILCTLFVLFLLHLDHKQSPDVSFALWIPTIWLLLIATRSLALWFGVSGESMEEGSPLDRAFLSVLFVFALLILAKRRFRWTRVIKENPWVILLIGYMLVSVVWSDVPYTSIKRWTKELIAVAMAFIVASEANPRQALQCIFRRIIYLLIPFSYILIHYFPKYGRIYGRWSGALMWIGAADHKNSLGILCLFTIFYLTWTLIRRRQERDKPIVWHQTYVEICLLILAIWLFMGPEHTFTYSVTSTVSLTIGLIAFIGLLWMKRQNILIGANTLTVIISIIIIFGTIVPFHGGSILSDAAFAFERSDTLTGRTEIWAYLVTYAMQKSIWGHGFGGFWTDVHRAASSSHAHNGYLDIILNLGFVGLILSSIFLIHCLRKAHKTLIYEFDWGCLWICILLMAVVHNIGESSIISFAQILPAAILFLSITPVSNNLNNQKPLDKEKCLAT